MGDFNVAPAISYQTISDQKSKCNLCEKIIFNILEKAHTNSHMPSSIDYFKPSLPNAIISEPTPAVPRPKGVKKTLIAPNPSQESHEKVSKAKGNAPQKQEKYILMDFDRMLNETELSVVNLPKKRAKKSLGKASRSAKQHPVSFYVKKFFEYKMYLDKLLQAYKRCRHLHILKRFRTWKKLRSPKIFNKPQ